MDDLERTAHITRGEDVRLRGLLSRRCFDGASADFHAGRSKSKVVGCGHSAERMQHFLCTNGLGACARIEFNALQSIAGFAGTKKLDVRAYIDAAFHKAL